MNTVEIAARHLPASEPSQQPETPPLDMRRIDRHLVSLVTRDSFEAEQYRRLRYVLENIRRDATGLVVAVCSPVTGDGKSVTAMNLAGALAQDEAVKALLIDCDLRRRSETLWRSLGMARWNGIGLTDAVINPALGLAQIAQPLPGLNLTVVPTGERDIPPYETLNSRKFAALIQEARRQYDFIILDAPPVIPVSDCAVLAKQVDGILLVVAAHQTPRALLEETLDLLDRRKLLGLLFNCSDQPSRRYYGYGNYYRRRPMVAARKSDRRQLPPSSTKA
ncbi:MAG TPA: CpsD/CapB family tyrosine-protein kinase [Gammaproteobacteria bacterium]|nr:CpsD/CapB family tyrosine-protein kinase [Gammaproteobacteria bacterium]